MYLGIFFVFIILLSFLFVVWVLFLFWGFFFAQGLYYSNFFLQKSYIVVLFIHNIKLQMYLNKQSVMLQFQ